MTPPLIKWLTVKDRHRLHSRVNSILIATSAFAIAGNVIQNGEFRFRGIEDNAIFACSQANLQIVLPIYGPLQAALKGILPDEIELLVVQKIAPPQGMVPFTEATRRVYLNLVAPYFVEYFETYKSLLRQHKGGRKHWPKTWRFGWAVRNAISHDNRIRIDDEDEPSVTWYGLSYTSQNNGHELFIDDLYPGDLILLMFEMNQELDAVIA